jgi:hypothetical protein
VNELQLVGYTADLKHLVFSDVIDGARFKVPVDDDLVATLSEVLQLVDPDRDPFQPAPAEPEPQPDIWGRPDAPAPARSGLFDDDDDDDFGLAAETAEARRNNGRKRGAKAGEGALAAFAASAEPAPRGGSGRAGQGAAAEDDRPAASKLSPREIQALLRSGMTPRQVARRAESNEAWVARWLAPIEAERRLVLEAVEQARVNKARLGESRDLLGEAVRKNLAEKGLRPDDDTVEWNASKREGDSHWIVSLTYRSRGRKQRAIWHFNPDTGDLDCRNALAVDVAWTRPRRGGRARSHTTVTAPTRKAMAGKKAAARKPAAKKAAVKKAVAKKPAAKKAAPAKRAVAKKAAPAKKAPVKKAAAKKAAAKRPAAAKRTAAGGAARKR